MDNLGEKLFELRKAKNLSQEEVAEKLNVTRQTVSKWETNQSTPDFDKIVPLCELFEISTDELLRGKKAELKKEEKSEEGEKGTELKADTKDMNKDEIRRKSANEISTSIFIYIVSIAVFIVIVSSTNIDAILSVGLLLIACAYFVRVTITESSLLSLRYKEILSISARVGAEPVTSIFASPPTIAASTCESTS